MSHRSNKVIGVIGCGNMGAALIQGILSREYIPPRHLVVWDSDAGKVKATLPDEKPREAKEKKKTTGEPKKVEKAKEEPKKEEPKKIEAKKEESEEEKKAREKLEKVAEKAERMG